jgi:hypothetical protein
MVNLAKNSGMNFGTYSVGFMVNGGDRGFVVEILTRFFLEMSILAQMTDQNPKCLCSENA